MTELLTAIFAFLAGFLAKHFMVLERERALSAAMREMAETTKRLNTALDRRLSDLDVEVRGN